MKNLPSLISSLAPRRKNTRRSGFTLIELLVAFSVIAVITGFGLSSFVSISRKQTIYEVVTNIKQAIDQARFNAISLAKPSSCTTASELTSFNFNFCYNGNSSCGTYVGNSRYSVNAICSNNPINVSTKNLPATLLFEDPASGTPCKKVTFNTVRSEVIGVPCSVRVSGFGQSITISLDSKGYVSF